MRTKLETIVNGLSYLLFTIVIPIAILFILAILIELHDRIWSREKSTETYS